MKTFVLSIVVGGIFCLGCERGLEPIQYGKDNCHWCQMRIMDPRFGSEAVTDKGRTYKFDSAECLLHYLHDTDAEHRHLAVTNFESPNGFMDAQTSWFLVSEKMPSPMGGFLNAFPGEAIAKSYQAKAGGKVFDWEGIKAEYRP